MSDALTPQQLQADPAAAPGTPALDLHEIQGDILIGLQKNFERFIFFQIADAAGFKAALPTVAQMVTTTSKVHRREFLLQARKKAGRTDILPLIGLNIGFTNDGLQKLAPGADLQDPAFSDGAQKRAKSLGDAVDGGGVPTGWQPEFLGDKIDGVLLVTGGTQDAVDDGAAAVLGTLGAAVTVLHNETGLVRPGLEAGHEHFGWKDGVSQPGINGLSNPFPGQRLLDPGHFVFGYPGEPAPPPARPAWMVNGSFMVFRRLQQLVPEFDQFVLDQGAALGMDPVLLGARLVGRWKSGAPMALTPIQDDPTVGGDPQQNNNFDFADDQAQRRCPFGAHIRKTNPRADLNSLADQSKTVDPRRIIRAGIPFGPEVTEAEEAAHKTAAERGLMFVCYQTSIPNQFEFVQISWVNSPTFVAPIPVPNKHPDGSPVTVGEDPIIGQNATPGTAQMDEPFPNYPAGNVRSTLTRPQSFVVPTGGGYFFMPSISALENTLSA